MIGKILRQSLEVFDRRDRAAWIVVRDDQEFELATNREWPGWPALEAAGLRE